MEDLTQRQTDILKAIIQEYTETGEAVGSEILEKKYKLGVSPATVRNEMVELAKKDYLRKSYFSSGRIPSVKGFRFYIKNIMKEKELSTTDEVAFKNSIWDERDEKHHLLSQATRVLADRTGLISIVATNTNDFNYAGVANLLTQREFLDLNLAKSLYEKLEEINFWGKVLNDFTEVEEEILYMLGEEDFEDPVFESCASILGEFEGRHVRGIIGVLGPKRMYYDIITPQVKYFSSLIGSIFKEQGI